FGLTGEHIAERVLRLYAKKLGLDFAKTEVTPVTMMLECSRCHAEVPLHDYLSESPLPTDEYCVECESRSKEACVACRVSWMKMNARFSFVCHDCREVAAAR
ncbi:MAG TPA: hypothetical protein VE077_21920, partial [Candidatus Methylomirabilis sp.]|nr:hypothetical protein [Candidatus Methylomirabilis sp.]